jgi:hypothetical protein
MGVKVKRRLGYDFASLLGQEPYQSVQGTGEITRLTPRRCALHLGARQRGGDNERQLARLMFRVGQQFGKSDHAVLRLDFHVTHIDQSSVLVRVAAQGCMRALARNGQPFDITNGKKPASVMRTM